MISDPDLARIGQYVRDCERAVKDQEARMSRWRPNQVPQSASRTLAYMNEVLQTARVHHNRMVSFTIHTLRMKLLQEKAKSGQILVEAGLGMFELPDQAGVNESIQDCVLLYLGWREFCQAERWNRSSGRLPPATVRDALQLLLVWHHEGRPAGDGHVI